MLKEMTTSEACFVHKRFGLKYSTIFFRNVRESQGILLHSISKSYHIITYTKCQPYIGRIRVQKTRHTQLRRQENRANSQAPSPQRSKLTTHKSVVLR